MNQTLSDALHSLMWGANNVTFSVPIPSEQCKALLAYIEELKGKTIVVRKSAR